MEFPMEWNDDKRMAVLFAPFRERSLNPASWDHKLKFWSDFISRFCNKNKKIIVELPELLNAFERKGRRPACLEAVCEHLIKDGQLQKRNELKLNENSSWASWGINLLVKQPASWAFGTFVKSPVSWTLGKMTGSTQNAQDPFGKLIFTSLLKEKADLIFLEEQTRMENERTDCIMSYEQFCKRHSALVPDVEDIDVVLIHLCNENRCSVFQTESQEKVIKFAKRNKRAVTPPKEHDTKIFKLHKAEHILEQQTEKLESEMQRLRIEAKQHLNQGHKQNATWCLRRRKRLERVREQKEQSRDNLHQLMLAVQQADANKLVIDAYSSGNEAFQALQSKHGIKSDAVDDVLIDLEQTFEDHDELNRSLAKVGSMEGDPDLELADLEEELEAMMAETDDSTLGDNTGSVVPPMFGEGMEETKPMAHQELLDSLCRMRVQQDDDNSMTLPDVPSFNPMPASQQKSVTLPSSHYSRKQPHTRFEPAT